MQKEVESDLVLQLHSPKITPTKILQSVGLFICRAYIPQITFSIELYPYLDPFFFPNRTSEQV